jgi:hypothetical protein
MQSFEDVVSEMVVLPTGVIVLSLLLFALLGILIVTGAVQTARKWRRLERDYGAGDLPALLKDSPRPKPEKGTRKAA